MNSDPRLQVRKQRRLLMNKQRKKSTDCLVWNGQISHSGYGRLMLKTDDGNRIVGASRAACQLCIGPVREDRIVLPRRRNRLFVNPEHLELVGEVALNYWHGP